MSKKAFILFLFLISSGVKSWSFATIKDSAKHYLAAINVSDPMLRLFSKNRTDTSVQSITAPILYLGREGKRMCYRLGIGGSRTSTSTTSELFNDTKTETIQKFRCILSVYRNTNISPKWNMQYGINLTAMMHNSDQIFDSGYDLLTVYSKNMGYGVGPGVLFQYQVSKNVKIFTEYMIIYQQIEGSVGKKFSAFPSESFAKQKTKYDGFQFDFPLALYLQFKF